MIRLLYISKIPEYELTIRKLDFKSCLFLIAVNPLCANFPRDPALYLTFIGLFCVCVYYLLCDVYK